MPTTVLIVGLGSIGQRHARILSERDDVLLSLCDAAAAHRQQTQAALVRPAVATYADYAIALEAKPEIVFVCTPNHLHVPMALQALEAGADLFVEKPLADELDEATRLVAAARAAGRFLQVGYMMRLDHGMQQMKELVDAGEIGNLTGGRAMVGTYVTLVSAKNRDRENASYSLVTDYTHEIDYVRWFFGEVKQVQALEAHTGAMEMKPNPNVFQMNLKMAGGSLVQIHLDYIQFPQRRVFEIHGDRGTLEYDVMTGVIRHFRYRREHVWETIAIGPQPARWDDMFRVQHAGILRGRVTGEPPLVSGEDGLAALQVAAAAIEAARTGATQSL